MVSVDIGAQEGAFGALFKGLGSAFQSQMEANQRGEAAAARLKFDKENLAVKREALAETKKKNTMNAAIKRIETLMPGGKMFQLKQNSPDLYKNLMGQYLTQGFPEIDPQSDTYKTMRQGLLGDGPQVKSIVSFLSNYSNKLTSRHRLTLVNMVKNDPGSLVDAMEQAGKWAEAFDEKQALIAVADKLKLPQGTTDSPQDVGTRSRAAIEEAIRQGIPLNKASIGALGGLSGQMASREKTEIEADLALNETAVVQKQGGAPYSILAKDVGTWVTTNPEGIVLSQRAMQGQAAQFLTKTQKGKTRGIRVDMAGLLGSAVQLRKDFARLGPGIAGFRGAFGESLSGILGQISPQLGKMVSKGITGADPAALAKFRADAQAMIAKLIPIFTGEESGRISEPEREIAKKASKALSKGASQAEILGALDSITNGAFLAADRSVVKAEGKPTWGFIQADGEVSEALWTSHFDRIQKITKMTDARVVNLLNALESQQRSFMATELWAGVEVQ
jgi:hypothetical protein